jgi:hypothetical protein
MGAGWSYYYWPGYYRYPYVHPYAVPYPYGPHVFGKIESNQEREGVSDKYYDHLYDNYAEDEVIGEPVHDGCHVVDEGAFFEMAHAAIPEAPTSELRSWRKSAEKHYQRSKENGDHDLAAHIKGVSTHISDELLERKSTEDPTHPDYSDDEEEDIDAEMDHYNSSVLTNHHAAERNALKQRNADNLEVLKSLAEASDIHELQENHKVAANSWKRMHIVNFGKGKRYGKGKKTAKVTVETIHVKTYHDDYAKIMEMHDTMTFQYVITAYIRELVGRAGRNMEHVSLMEYYKDQKEFSDSIANALKRQAADFTVGMAYHICFYVRNTETARLHMLDKYVEYFTGQFKANMSEHLDLERSYIENNVAANIGPAPGRDDATARIAEARKGLNANAKKMATLFANLFAGVDTRNFGEVPDRTPSAFGTQVYQMILDEWNKHITATVSYTALLTSKGFTQTVSESDKRFLDFVESGQKLGKYMNALAYKRGGDALPSGEAMKYIKETMELAKGATEPVAPALPPRSDDRGYGYHGHRGYGYHGRRY